MSDPALTRLRCCVGASTVLALTGLAVTGIVPAAAAAAMAAVAVSLAAVATRRTAASDSAAQGIVLVVVLAVAAVTARHGATVPTAAVRDGAAPVAAALATAQPLLWRTVRELAAGAVLAAGLVVVCCAAAPSPPELLVVAPVWMLLLVAARDVREARAASGRVVARIAGGRRPAVGVGAVGLAVAYGVAVFLVLPVPDHPRFAMAGAGGAAGSRSGARAPGEFNGDEMSLLARGRLSSAPVLAVPADSPTLWRGAVFDHYDGTGWTATPPEMVAPRVAWPATLTPAWTRWTSPDTPAARDDAEASVVRLDPTDPTVYAPGDVVAVRSAYGVVSSRLGGDVRLESGDLSGTAAYVVRWRPPAPATVAPAGPSPRDPVDPRWRQLPAELPDRVRALAATVTAGAPTRAAAVAAIERWLRGHAVYTLDAPLPRAGADAVDDFLFRSREGFCEHFASAETVLLRSIGVPARVATGLAYGRPLPGGQRGYAWQDEHAWVEVYYPGAGWVASDPTAGTRLADPASSARGLAGVLRSAWRRLAGVPGGRPALAGVVLLLVTAAGVASGPAGRAARRALRLLRRPRRAAVAPTPAQAAYVRLQDRLRPVGADRRPHETLRDLQARLGAWSAADLAAAFAVLEDEWYAATPYDAERSAAAAAALDAVAPVP